MVLLSSEAWPLHSDAEVAASAFADTAVGTVVCQAGGSLQPGAQWMSLNLVLLVCCQMKDNESHEMASCCLRATLAAASFLATTLLMILAVVQQWLLLQEQEHA